MKRSRGRGKAANSLLGREILNVAQPDWRPQDFAFDPEDQYLFERNWRFFIGRQPYLNYPGDAECRKADHAFDRKADALNRVAVEAYLEIDRLNKASLQATQKPKYIPTQTEAIRKLAMEILSGAFAETIPEESLRIPVRQVIGLAMSKVQ